MTECGKQDLGSPRGYVVYTLAKTGVSICVLWVFLVPQVFLDGHIMDTLSNRTPL